jgi:hypothetical protein
LRCGHGRDGLFNFGFGAEGFGGFCGGVADRGMVFQGQYMTRKEMVLELVYNDIYSGDRDEFIKRALRHGFVGYDNFDDAALDHACKLFGLGAYAMPDEASED